MPGTTWYCIRSSKHSFSCRLHSSTPFHSDHTALKAFRPQLSLAWFSCHTKGVLAETGWASKVWVLQTMSRFKIDASDDRIEKDKKHGPMDQGKKNNSETQFHETNIIHSSFTFRPKTITPCSYSQDVTCSTLAASGSVRISWDQDETLSQTLRGLLVFALSGKDL